MRKAAVAAGSAGAAAAARAKSGSGTTASAAPAALRVPAARSGATAPTTATPTTATSANPTGAGRSSGWPVMTPPDLPARPVPRAPLTDVVPKRTLIIIAVVVVLAVLATVLALTLSDDGDDAAGGTDGGTVATGSPSAETKGDESDGTRTDGTATGPADKETGPAAGAGRSDDSDDSAGDEADDEADDESENEADDDGGTTEVRTHKGNQGYSIGLPEGWTYQSTGLAGDRFAGPNGQKLLIGWTTTPKDDPVADWTNQERGMVRSQYQRIRIESVDYRGWNTADWEFTYVDSGTKYRSIDRGTVVGARLGYGLMYTAKAAEWDGDQREDTWRTLTTTFQPKS
ncbi:hypothetical protein SHKM778_10060 [Streptomyces sp. KM77-8]|uniref:Serine/threonine protein kinase n=1 Tax=Streptomyces haneummycinicus TaxID=3074435 RepID=A0AAT9HB70_9ACTN